MKHLKIVLLMLLAIGLNSCSSVKVLKAWKAPNVATFNDNNILVVARTANQEAREAFENEITEKLQDRGFNATASYTKFPELKPDTKLTDERKEKIKEMLQTEGYNGVVLSILKDYQERTRVIGEGGYDASVNYGYRDLPSYVGGGFYVYYHHPLSYSTEDIYVPESEDTITSKLYVLQTAAFDLDQPEEQQLLAYINAAVENPSTAKSAASEYADAIAKGFKKTKTGGSKY